MTTEVQSSQVGLVSIKGYAGTTSNNSVENASVAMVEVDGSNIFKLLYDHTSNARIFQIILLGYVI